MSVSGDELIEYFKAEGYRKSEGGVYRLNEVRVQVAHPDNKVKRLSIYSVHDVRLDQRPYLVTARNLVETLGVSLRDDGIGFIHGKKEDWFCPEDLEEATVEIERVAMASKAMERAVESLEKFMLGSALEYLNTNYRLERGSD